ncbi:MAG: acyl-CoA thioesterase [Anaerolineae bacterium]
MFKTKKMVRFEHCDPAGLIFYPRYFQLSHQVVEDWFKDGLGFSHAYLVVTQRIGIPTVHIAADFVAASRLEEILEYTLQVEKLGNSSVTLSIEAHHDSELRCRIKQVIVFSQLDPKEVKSVSIPDEIRTKMEQFKTEKV